MRNEVEIRGKERTREEEETHAIWSAMSKMGIVRSLGKSQEHHLQLHRSSTSNLAFVSSRATRSWPKTHSSESTLRGLTITWIAMRLIAQTEVLGIPDSTPSYLLVTTLAFVSQY